MIFDFTAIHHVEFYVAVDRTNDTFYRQIPVERAVKLALVEILTATKDQLRLSDPAVELESFELSQKYGEKEALVAQLTDAHFARVQEMTQLANVPVDAAVLREADALAYYLVRFVDAQGKRLLAVRRANHFKGILKAKLISLVDDTLQLDTRPVFKLDNDFDYLVAEDTIYILRPSGLEYTAAVGEQIRAAIAETVSEVRSALPFLNFDSLTDYVRTHRRAARLLAALRTRADLGQTSREKFLAQCRRCNLRLERAEDGTLAPAEGHELRFLQVLDRRLYDVSLIPRTREVYEAANRRSANGAQPAEE